MRFTYADDRVPVSMTYNGLTYYLTYDQIGSLRAVVDTSGNIVKRIDYDAYGSIINDTNPSLSVPFGFAGGLHDRDTGLVRFGARDYDPTLGRWTAKDPIDFAGADTNLYGYVANDPVGGVDPEGLQAALPVPQPYPAAPGVPGQVPGGNTAIDRAINDFINDWSERMEGVGSDLYDYLNGTSYFEEHTKGARPSTEPDH
ncbi:MAG: tRNA nuclease WapA precursor [Syntrophorhabdus sp. PtaU1.Bin050]|nr:MAG: tRNA nuclease WapA precursor [Syntrophorhabdus sp. PtaU1.Bin050]